METIQTANETLRVAAENHAGHKLVHAPVMSVGEMFAQGDIGILRIGSLPSGAQKCERPTGGQVAPGTSKGSRHCVEGDGIYYRFYGEELSDLCFESETDWTLVHPEHGHVAFQPGLYQFVHQQNERNERVRD